MITNCIHKTTLCITPLQILAQERADKYDDMICSGQQSKSPNKKYRQTRSFYFTADITERVVIIMEYGHVPLSHPLLPMHHPEHGNVIAP